MEKVVITGMGALCSVGNNVEEIWTNLIEGKSGFDKIKRISTEKHDTTVAAEIKSDEYYINMMIAWYFATALAKQWNIAIKYLENKKLSSWVHNKTIQKAVESYRINDEQKNYLKTLKIKK